MTESCDDADVKKPLSAAERVVTWLITIVMLLIMSVTHLCVMSWSVMTLTGVTQWRGSSVFAAVAAGHFFVIGCGVLVRLALAAARR